MALFPSCTCGDVDLDIPLGALVESAGEGSSSGEARLLASDSDGEPPVRAVRAPSPPRVYYVDVQPERGNLAVSTLYYPGRPRYERAEVLRRSRPGRQRRYYEASVPADSRAEELAAQAGRYQRALADSPRDEPLWLLYIEFEEACRDAEGALRAAERALVALPESRALQSTLHRARVRVLPPARLLDVLRDTVQQDAAPSLESWLRMLAALATSSSPDEVAAASGAALARLRRVPAAYPHVLYAYGAFLRDAGLWERLVLLVELVATMNFPGGVFPPSAPDSATAERLDCELAELEDKVTASALPLNTVWVRVERARAAVHWRPASLHSSDPDPQRKALPADVADLLLPAMDSEAAFLLSVQLLRLAKVPLFPSTEYVRRAVSGSGLLEEELGAAWEANSAEALLPLVRAARRLPNAHPARPAGGTLARDLLAQFLDPPHYFSDRAGYLSWVGALWEASCEWATGERRLALLCWRLRWLHALLLLLDPKADADATEVRRIVSEARSALKKYAEGAPVAYAQFARIHLVAAGAERARHTVLHAVRAALCDPACPVTHRLYVARVAGELGAGVWPVVCAALDLPLPTVSTTAPDPNLQSRASQLCEEQCAVAEARWADPAAGATPEEDVCAALLPGVAEWAGARLALATPERVRCVLRHVLRRRTDTPVVGAAELRYLEQSACGAACAGRRHHQFVQRARSLAPHFPHSALLALGASGAALGVWDTSVEGGGTAPAHRLRALTAAARSHTSALAHLLPALWRALDTAWEPQGAERVRRACARASRLGCGGALVHAVALDAEARAGTPRTHQALLHALDRLPNHKWLYVRGAAWCVREAAALPDVLLDRQLRLHALRDELAAPPDALPRLPLHQ